MDTTCVRLILWPVLLLVVCPQVSAQQTAEQQLKRYLKDLDCDLEYLADQKSPDGTPVVRLHRLPSAELDEEGFIEKRLDYIAKHTVVHSVSFRRTNHDIVRRCLARLPHLEEIHTDRPISPDCLKLLKEIRNLRSLNLSGASFGNSELDEEAELKVKRESFEVLGTIRQLRVLNLSGIFRLTDDDLKPLVGLTNLEELDLSHNAAITDKGLHVVSQITSLRRLRLRCVGYTDKGLEALKGLTKLELLHLEPLGQLGELALKERGLPLPKLTEKVLKPLQHFSEMRDLSLRYMPMDPDQGLSFLTKMPKLENLELSYIHVNFVPDVAAAKRKKDPNWHADLIFSDFSEFRDLKQLRRITLSETPIVDKAFEKFPTSDKLETLTLSLVCLNGKDLKPLPKKAPNLKSLTLECLWINDPDFVAFSALKHLKILTINSCGFFPAKVGTITPDGLTTLKKALPQVTIEHTVHGPQFPITTKY